jgi:predicted enzyme related to lactoylglutathione lyase
MTPIPLRPLLLSLVPALALCAADAAMPDESPATAARAVEVHYLEYVTPDVEATCSALAKMHGIEFGEPVAELGNARTAALDGGGQIGVRAPMHAKEESVVRPYLLVDDIESAVEAARAAGAEIAVPPTEIPGRGTFAIYFQGDLQHGLWQL